jgi:hypothetical protein
MVFCYILLTSGSLLILPEGFVVGFCNFACNKNIRIPTTKKIRGSPLHPALCDFGAEKGGILKICQRVPKLKIRLRRGLGEVFTGDSADTCDGKFLLMSMGGANGQACADGERGPPSARAEIW